MSLSAIVKEADVLIGTKGYINGRLDSNSKENNLLLRRVAELNKEDRELREQAKVNDARIAELTKQLTERDPYAVDGNDQGESK